MCPCRPGWRGRPHVPVRRGSQARHLRRAAPVAGGAAASNLPHRQPCDRRQRPARAVGRQALVFRLSRASRLVRVAARARHHRRYLQRARSWSVCPRTVPGRCRCAPRADCGRRPVRAGASRDLPEPRQRRARRLEAAHAVHAAAGRRRGRAEEEARVRRRVRVEPRDGAREELERVGDAAGDRAADVVRVVALEVGRCSSRGARGCGRGSPARSARSGARSRRCMSTVEPVRHVAVGVAGVLAGRRARRVELALLAQDEERPLGVPAATHVALRGADLLERAADVHGRRLAARGIAPRDRTVERPVELEDAGPVAVAARGGGGSRPAARRPRCARAGRATVSKSTTRAAAGRRGARRGGPSRCGRRGSQVGGERARDRVRAARRDRPVLDVRGEREEQPDRRGERLRERQDRVRGAAGEERARALARGSGGARAGSPRTAARSPKRSERDGCAGSRSGASGSARSPCGSLEERAHEPRVGARVARRARRRSARASGRAAPRARRRADARPRRAGGSRRARARRAAACGRTARGSPIGCTAEQTSCTKPGSVSSALRVPPPTSLARLDTRAPSRRPARARSRRRARSGRSRRRRRRDALRHRGGR